MQSLMSLRRASSYLSSFLLISISMLATGCGSSGSTSKTLLSGNTTVTLLLSSTANDQLAQFNVGMQSVTLTSQSGKTVDLFNSESTGLPYGEFIHLNGTGEPFVTVSVPQDVYTAATMSLNSYGGFACVSELPAGGPQYPYFFIIVSQSSATVNLLSPITITGTSMVLSMDLQVSQSATFSGCYDGNPSYSITPTFNLTSVALSAEPTNVKNGKESGIEGVITSVDGGESFSLGTADGATLPAHTNESTLYQNASGFAALAEGLAVDMDAAIQSDGSLLATRVEVDDADPTTVTVVSGPLLEVLDSGSFLYLFMRQHQGFLFGSALVSGGQYFGFANSAFQISGQLANLRSLPFAASFNAANMFAGQNVSVTTHATTFGSGGPSLSVVTLVPQTINGTVTAVSNSGGFSTYTVALAAYDIIPTLAVQLGQTTVLSDPSNVVVYVDSNAQLLNTKPLAVGSVLRFNGLLFNDSGILRMDCGQVNDGVAE